MVRNPGKNTCIINTVLERKQLIGLYFQDICE